ncbi:hypothetical protein [Sinorhizobium sp. NFACC03]|uniref:hypothetical protein n=1 Tax=Sinorhizobium sp. NFACC03 TaxID=1566295 RepID=UPI000888CE8E|nr:hypothetical protein [Sinorhizobium sp. NFACC03]SDA58665.1 hypothetical protein SAMN03159448_01551 [Sinorhizobium sp. NFACC03]
MDGPDSFEIQCTSCSARERLSFHDMETREVIRCAACGTARSMEKEDVLEICREAAKMTRQRL